MNTIVRTKSGIVNIRATVVKTIYYLINNQPGFYSIADVKKAINEQLQPKEQLTKKMIRRALVQVLEK